MKQKLKLKQKLKQKEMMMVMMMIVVLLVMAMMKKDLLLAPRILDLHAMDSVSPILAAAQKLLVSSKTITGERKDRSSATSYMLWCLSKFISGASHGFCETDSCCCREASVKQGDHLGKEKIDRLQHLYMIWCRSDLYVILHAMHCIAIALAQRWGNWAVFSSTKILI
jgi:hypothetical protein